MTLAADSLTIGWLQTIAVFQIIGVLLTAASVAGALWVIFWRDPALAREREADRHAERQLEARAELERYRAEARAVLITAERAVPIRGSHPRRRRLGMWCHQPQPQRHHRRVGHRVGY